MFQSLINRAQRSIDTLVSRYVARAAVAVPFIVAMGFGTAAASVKLTQVYGNLTAYTILAAAFAGIGLIAAAGIAFSGSGEPASSDEPEAEEAAQSDTESNLESAIDPATVMSALTTVGPVALPHVLRLLARNLPLVLGLLVLAYLLFADAGKEQPAAATVANT
jgi:hypothetical protein